jgi:hypothetical protein
MMDRKPLATIDEPGGYRLDIYENKDDTGWTTGYDAERTAPDDSITTPQTGMTAEECIRYLSHIANGLAYNSSGRR